MLDAAACGLPVIVSDQVAAYTIYNQNEVNYQTQPNILAEKYSTNNAEALANELLKLQDSGFRKEIGTIVYQRVEQYSSWKAIANKRLIDYRNL
jgi:glycosyltransferase involved in cell wall biosynthesis